VIPRELARRVAAGLFPRWYHRRAVLSGAKLHDMVAEPDEQFYAEEYLHHVRTALSEAGAKTVLDLGCGQGRIAIPLAQDGYQVTAVDWSPDALAAAKRYAAGRRQPTFHRGEIIQWLRETPDSAYDAVLALEVLYMMDGWRRVVNEAYRVVAAGGVCILGFRPQLFYLRYHARRGEFDLVARVSQTREGRLGRLLFNWHTRKEVEGLVRAAGFRQVSCAGIGILSGLEGDPLETLARPARLTPAGRRALLEMEVSLAEAYPDEGRYLLAITRK
jgi:SAM-dependent methyltransferase